MAYRWLKNVDDSGAIEHLLMDDSIHLRSRYFPGVLNQTGELTFSGNNPLVVNTVPLLDLCLSGGRWDVSFLGNAATYAGNGAMSIFFLFVLDGALRAWSQGIVGNTAQCSFGMVGLRSIVQCQSEGSKLSLRVGWSGSPMDEYFSTLDPGSVFSALRVGNYR